MKCLVIQKQKKTLNNTVQLLIITEAHRAAEVDCLEPEAVLVALDQALNLRVGHGAGAEVAGHGGGAEDRY